MKPLLTVNEVAQILRVKPKRVYELDIPKYKVGASNKYSEEDIKEWLEKNKDGRLA